MKWPFLLLNHNSVGTEMRQASTKEWQWMDKSLKVNGRVSEACDNLVLCSSTSHSQESMQDGTKYITYLDFSSQRIAMLTREIWVHTDMEGMISGRKGKDGIESWCRNKFNILTCRVIRQGDYTIIWSWVSQHVHK